MAEEQSKSLLDTLIGQVIETGSDIATIWAQGEYGYTPYEKTSQGGVTAQGKTANVTAPGSGLLNIGMGTAFLVLGGVVGLFLLFRRK